MEESKGSKWGTTKKTDCVKEKRVQRVVWTKRKQTFGTEMRVSNIATKKRDRNTLYEE